MTDNNPLISIIVPVYNVQDYVDKCIHSLVSQKYQNIEIILVDDGSTDNSPTICQHYDNQYPNVIYHRQKNGGLSFARNTGISLSHGKFIMFVDSDDYVDSNFCSNAIQSQIQYDSDIVIFGYYRESETISTCLTLGNKTRQLSMYEAFSDLIKDSYAWNKLYRRELFDEIKYPVGKTYEDGYTTYRLYNQAKAISYVAKATYHYVETGQSIVSSKSASNIQDQYGAVVSLFTYLDDKYPEVATKYRYELVISSIRFVTYVPSNFDSTLYKRAYQVLKTSKIPKELDLTHKLSLILFKISSPLAIKIFKSRRN